MQQSKNIAISMLLGAVLVGGALGFTADRMMMREGLDRRSSFREELANRLLLDAIQRARLDSILDDRHRKWQVIMAPVQPAIDSIKARARDEIRSMLNAKQLAEFEKVLAEASDPNKTRDNDDN